MNRRLALKLLSAAPVWAQSFPRYSRFVPGTGGAPLLVMDAVVTGNEGKPVRDLGPGDFSVREGDQPRTVAAFAAVDAVSGASRDAAPLPLPVEIDPGDVHRTFAMVVDDAGISIATGTSLRAALTRFVNEQLTGRDVAAVIRSAGGIGPLEQLTSDKSVLAAAIEGISLNPAATPPSAPAWPETLRYALTGLRTVSGRKAVVVFWERAPEKPAFDPLIALANRAWTSIYTVDCGPSPAAPSGEMARLTGQTGGMNLALDLPAALASILQDQESYYLLGFRSQSSAYPREDPVSVKVLRPGLDLRSRSSPPEMVPPESYADSGSPDDELRRVIASPFDAAGIHLGISALPHFASPDSIYVMLQVDGRDVAVTHRLNGIGDAGLDLLLRVHGADGREVDDHPASQALHLTTDLYRQMLYEGLNYAMRLPAPKPGAIVLRMAVRDATSSRTGVAHRLVEIPDISKGELAVSGIALELADVSNSAPETSVLAHARCIFHPGEGIAYRCSIYNVTADARNRAELEVRTSVYRDGRTLYAGTPMAVTAPDVSNRKWLSLRGKLELGGKAISGEFVLQLTVTDKLAAKPRASTQWTDFTVV